jgi:hypothetical protein
MAEWVFEPEDNEDDTTKANVVEYRPHKMGLGCTDEMIKEKIAENAKNSRLRKLLKRKEFIDRDGGTTMKRKGVISDSEDEVSKSLVSKKITPTVMPIQRTKNKRNRAAKLEK